MNMPLDEQRRVHFTTTLFALIRESLDVKKRHGNRSLNVNISSFSFSFSFLAIEEIDTADEELRSVICNIWPTLAKKQVKLHEGGTKSLLDLVVPPKNGSFFIRIEL